ncbi:MAG: hypothetical protein QG564_1839 [Campylobacterota bacterium]|nr:hypothetical protein [Campylobacterota bacterium]
MSSNYKVRPDDEEISYIEKLQYDASNDSYFILFKTFIDNVPEFLEFKIEQWEEFFDGDGLYKMDRKIKNYELMRDFIKIKRAEKIYNHYDKLIDKKENTTKRLKV